MSDKHLVVPTVSELSQPDTLPAQAVHFPDETCRIERLVPGGKGMGRSQDGRVVFAPGTAPSDLIRIERQKQSQHFAEAVEFELVERGAGRVEPECPYYAACGGCDLMHLSRSTELEQKRIMLEDALTRVGKFSSFPRIQVVHLGEEGALGYRNRQRFHLSYDGKVGFFSAGSHHLVEIDDCLVAHPTVATGLRALRQHLAAHPELSRAVGEAEIRISPIDLRASLRLILRKGARRPIALTLGALAKHFDRVVMDAGPSTHAATNANEMELQLFPVTPELAAWVPVTGFVQVNSRINLKLVAHLVQGALGRQAQTFLDLYSGAGNFSLALAHHGLLGLGLEQSHEATLAAKKTAQERDLGARLRLRSGDVRVLIDQALAAKSFDLLVLNPPRRGASEVFASLAKKKHSRPRHIAYSSCDPVTLARDLRSFATLGYQLAELTLFDMFPRTHHFESVAWLESRVAPP